MKKTIVISGLENWNSQDIVKTFLNTIFCSAGQDDLEFCEEILKQINVKNIRIQSLWDLIGFLRIYFKENIRWSEDNLSTQTVDRLYRLSQFEQGIVKNFDAYKPETKPNPSAVRWPNAEKDPQQNIFKTLPYSKNYGLVTRSTPVGSAGSCFAFEISAHFQRNNFNYVITEQEHDFSSGVLSDGEVKTHARFSANWGLLFNTGTLRQLAERAFGIRETPRILIAHPPIPGANPYDDPFREHVYFATPEAYEDNYDKHTAAAREALLQSKVFVVTLGLNEVWEYLGDGSAISHNPMSCHALTAMLKHRILSVQENINNVQRFLDIVRAHNPDFKLIISVSPVSLNATFRGYDQHVLAADGHSKATLRVVAEEIVNANSGVYYFPSFELVNRAIQSPWEKDQRHVTREAVGRVMELFSKMFVVE